MATINEELKLKFNNLRNEQAELKLKQAELEVRLGILENKFSCREAISKLNDCDALANNKFKEEYRKWYKPKKYARVPDLREFVDDPPDNNDDDFDFWKDFCNKFEVGDKFEIICTDINEDSYHTIEKYLKMYPELATYDNSYFFKLIAMTGKIELVKLFVKYGANIIDDNHTILYICASKKYYDVMEYILNLGENIENIWRYDGYNDAKNYLRNKIPD